jgi:hypothetical protein
MRTYWGCGVSAPRIFKLGTGCRWMVRFTPQPLYSQGKSLRTRSMVVWVGPRTGLDAVAKGRNLFPCRESNPGRPARSLVAIRRLQLIAGTTKIPSRVVGGPRFAIWHHHQRYSHTAFHYIFLNRTAFRVLRLLLPCPFLWKLPQSTAVAVTPSDLCSRVLKRRL